MSGKYFAYIHKTAIANFSFYFRAFTFAGSMAVLVGRRSNQARAFSRTSKLCKLVIHYVQANEFTLIKSILAIPVLCHNLRFT